jgi:hypothetical protein
MNNCSPSGQKVPVYIGQHASMKLTLKIVKQIGSATSAGRGQLVNLIVTVNAAGNHIPLMFIFHNVHIKDSMFKGANSSTGRVPCV